MDDSGAEILPPAKGVLWMTHAETVHLVLSQNAVDDSGAGPVFWGCEYGDEELYLVLCQDPVDDYRKDASPLILQPSKLK